MKRFLRGGERYALSKHKPKYLKIRYISLLAVLTTMCLYAVKQVSAQQAAPAATVVADIKPLQIGEIIPNVIWETPLSLLNHPSGIDSIKLTDHRGKVIILDFWATYCSSCLKSMPKLDSIQQANPDRLFTLLVNPNGTRDDAQKIRRTLDKQPVSIGLPTLYQDTVLTPLFDIRRVPTLVWIDEHGAILAITNRRAISPEFVNHLLTYPNNLP